MSTRTFKQLVIPTIAKPSLPATDSNTVTTADLNKTHYVINSLQTNVAQALKPVLSNPLVTNGITLKSIALFAGQPNYVSHNLGQTLQGWSPSRPQSFCALWEDATQSNLGQQIVLWTYIDTVTDLLVW